MSGLQAVEHLHVPLEVGTTEHDRHERGAVAVGRPDADLLALAMHGGVRDHRSLGQRRQIDGHLGTLADRWQGLRHRGEADLREQLLGDRVGPQFRAQHLALQRLPAARTQRHPRRQCGNQAAGADLVESGVDPQRARIHHLHHGLARDDGGARLHVARSDHAVRRRREPQAAALRAQRLQVGQGSCLVFACGGECGIGELQVLPASGQQFLARRLLGEQLLVAAGLGVGIRLACRGVGHGGGGALHHRLLRAQPVVAVHRVHLAQHLTGLDGIADLDVQALEPARGDRPDAVELARLDAAHTEQRRTQRTRLDLHHGDGHRRQRP